MPPELGPIDSDVLDHIARYRFGVPELLGPMPLFEGVSSRRVRGTLQNLRTEGYLMQAPLYENRSHDYLTKECAAAIDMPHSYGAEGGQAP